jgi:hypothetical protein
MSESDAVRLLRAGCVRMDCWRVAAIESFPSGDRGTVINAGEYGLLERHRRLLSFWDDWTDLIRPFDSVL